MSLKKYFLIYLPLLLLILVSIFLFFKKPSDTIALVAAVIGATPEAGSVETEETTENEVVFSDEEVSNITTTDTILEEKRSASSTIAIENENKRETFETELVVEETHSKDNISRNISYKYDTTTLINDIHALSNEIRKGKNVPALVFDAKLSQLASERSADMAKNNYLSHTSPDGCDLECRFKNSKYETYSWGENLAEYEPYTTRTASTLAKELVDMWFESSEHRNNLISDNFTHHGIGVGMSGNRIVVTVIFARP